VLLYADGGEAELMANDPELGDMPMLQPLRQAELELFGSSAEVMLLRLGIVVGSHGSAAADLAERVKSGNLPVPAGRQHFVPLLDRATLAEALVEVAASKLHGGWDLVADDAPLGELVQFVAAEVGGPAPVTVPLDEAIAAAGVEAATRWLMSRKVTGRNLRETGAVDARPWQDIVREALA
jgi:NAD dependent epimerase/dehydratase family enzyme